MKKVHYPWARSMFPVDVLTLDFLETFQHGHRKDTGFVILVVFFKKVKIGPIANARR